MHDLVKELEKDSMLLRLIGFGFQRIKKVCFLLQEDTIHCSAQSIRSNCKQRSELASNNHAKSIVRTGITGNFSRIIMIDSDMISNIIIINITFISNSKIEQNCSQRTEFIQIWFNKDCMTEQESNLIISVRSNHIFPCGHLFLMLSLGSHSPCRRER